MDGRAIHLPQPTIDLHKYSNYLYDSKQDLEFYVFAYANFFSILISCSNLNLLDGICSIYVHK